MNAFEFVKERGVGVAKAFLDLPEYTIDQLMMLQAGLRCVDLKRIVDSHGIVADFGGVSEIKNILSWVGADEVQLSDKAKVRLKQAISDVEACQ